MGADSAALAGWEIRQRLDKKVFKNGPMLFGFAGSFRMGQLLQYKLVIPNHAEGKDVFQYMVQDFVEAVRTCLRDGGQAQTEKEIHSIGNGLFLVGYRGRLFLIDGDFQVAEDKIGFMSIGCGQNYALGAMYVSTSKDPFVKMRHALEAAEEFSNGVRGPFNFESMKKGRR